jgi:hypothetical protein
VLLLLLPPPITRDNLKFTVIELEKELNAFTFKKVRRKSKAIPVTGHEGPKSCEMSGLPHFLDSWLTGGNEVVSLMHRPLFTPQGVSWYSFLEAESNPGSQ